VESHGKHFRNIDFTSVYFLLLLASTTPVRRNVWSEAHFTVIDRGTAMIKKFARIAGITGAGALAIGAATAGANLLGVAHADPAPRLSRAGCCQG
jgi:hypothetical protein